MPKMPNCLSFLSSLTMAFRLFSAAFSASVLTSSFAIAQPSPLEITNVFYLDSYSKSMVRAERITIEDGKITSINDPDYACVACENFDMAGGYVIPGLIDIHQHLDKGGFAKESTTARIALLRRNLYWGITSVFNPSVPADVMNMVKGAVANNPLNYPRFLSAGRHIGPTGGWGDIKTSTVGGIKTAIDNQIEAGAVIIKLSFDNKSWLTPNPLPLFSEAALRSAIDYAHKRERRVFVHATNPEQAKTAIRAGADGLMSGLVAGGIDDELLTLMRRNRTAYVATLTATAVIVDVQNAVTRQQQYDPQKLHGTGLYQSLNSPIMAQNWRDWWPLSTNAARHMTVLERNTKKIIDAGIMVGIGTDAGTPAVILGASLADEMARHVEIGVSPIDTIIMATQANARLLFLDRVTGTVDVGKDADLVFMEADPSNSIDALKTIQYVMRGGRLYDRREFENTR
ncbi:amidohydrolase family protein [Kordiimonas aquimaris]|uniref:amidohydrolase family protein n=1 Tax=Kordiimonas aquimaris TaxID=707591 RepID=UPI0021D19033|nr:amidohydrolase family protein [Kordiimonas aquimaris]